jgi:hypothetical protein
MIKENKENYVLINDYVSNPSNVKQAIINKPIRERLDFRNSDDFIKLIVKQF